jgi:hypothetical protein
VRKDLMSMLGTMRDQGIAGVRAGLNSGAFLPGLVGAILIPALHRTVAPAATRTSDAIQ